MLKIVKNNRKVKFKMITNIVFLDTNLSFEDGSLQKPALLPCTLIWQRLSVLRVYCMCCTFNHASRLSFVFFFWFIKMFMSSILGQKKESLFLFLFYSSPRIDLLFYFYGKPCLDDVWGKASLIINVRQFWP